MTEHALLEISDLTVRFGGLSAVDGVGLSCGEGELTGLIGPNGAGKTTLIDAVTGFLPRNATGSIRLAGDEVLGRAPHRLAQDGLCRTWQTLELFDDITVRANLDVASRRLTAGAALRDYFRPSPRDERVEHVLELLELDGIADSLPRELSQGYRKMVGVGRALVGRATILLLDEPAAGLDRAETQWFGEQLRRLVAEGCSILLVDHDMHLVLGVCDHIHVLVSGKVLSSGTPSEIRGNRDVVAAYLGRHGGDG